MAQAIEVDDSIKLPENSTDDIEERVTADKGSCLGSIRHSVSVKSL